MYVTAVRLSTRRMLPYLALVLAVFSGCEWQPTAPDSPATSQPMSSFVGLDQTGEVLDDHIARFAASVPGGFGGMFRDDGGVINVYIVDEGRDEEVVQALLNLQRSAPGAIPLTPMDIRILKGRYDFPTLLQWYRTLLAENESRLLGLGDVDDRHNIIRLGVGSSTEVQAVREALRRIGVPDDAAIVEVTPPIQFEGGADLSR